MAQEWACSDFTPPHLIDNLHAAGDLLAMSRGTCFSWSNSCITVSSSGRATTTADSTEFRAEQCASDQIYEKVIDEDETLSDVKYMEPFTMYHRSYQHIIINPQHYELECGRRATEDDVDERGGNEHHGGDGRTGRGWLVMSERGGSDVRRSSHFTHNDHIDGEDSQW